jgi:hypothetical protein
MTAGLPTICGKNQVSKPDPGAYLRAYSGPWELLADMRPLDRTANGWRDRWLGKVYQTKMQFMNAVFRQRYEHKYAYDDETLVLVMHEAGFADAVVQQFGISIDPKMAPDSYERRTESLYGRSESITSVADEDSTLGHLLAKERFTPLVVARTRS